MRWATAILALTVFALASGSIRADEEAAKFFSGRGRKALEDKDLDEAERNFTKALGEQEGFLPALLGLAEVYRDRGDKPRAIGYLETILDRRDKGGLDEEQTTAVAKAEEILGDLDRPRLEYRELVNEYVRKLADLARRSVTDNPDVARRCLGRIFSLDADHPVGKALQEELKITPARPGEHSVSSAAAGPGENVLFDGKSLDGWSSGPPVWNLETGLMVVKAEDGAYYSRHERILGGDYTVAFELRMAKETGDTPCIGFEFGFQGVYDSYSLNMFKKRFVLVHNLGAANKEAALAKVDFFLLKGNLDRSAWNRYEIQVEGNIAVCRVNGVEICSYKADKNDFDGAIALLVQDCEAEVRKVTVVGGK